MGRGRDVVSPFGSSFQLQGRASPTPLPTPVCWAETTKIPGGVAVTVKGYKFSGFIGTPAVGKLKADEFWNPPSWASASQEMARWQRLEFYDSKGIHSMFSFPSPGRNYPGLDQVLFGSLPCMRGHQRVIFPH